MIVCDANALYIAYDRSEPRHQLVVAALRAERQARLLSPFVLAEVDYLLATRLGVIVEDQLLADVEDGVYQLCAFETDDVRAARSLVSTYKDLNIGLADASNVVLAHRYSTTNILTFDERHFRALRPLSGVESFTLLPLDATGG